MITLHVVETKGLSRAIGLIGKKEPVAIFFKTRWGIHTLGMRFPIDVLILDSANKVVAMRSLAPNHIFIWNPKYEKVLELPNGMIEKKKITIGDNIEVLITS